MSATWRTAGLLALIVGIGACAEQAFAPAWRDVAEQHATIELTSVRLLEDGETGEGIRVTSAVRFSEDAAAEGTVDDLQFRTLTDAERRGLAAAVPAIRRGEQRATGARIGEAEVLLGATGAPAFSEHTVTSRDERGDELKLVALRLKDPSTGEPGLLGPALLFRNGDLAAILTPLGGRDREASGLRVVSYGADRRVLSVSEIRASGVSSAAIGGFLGRIGAALDASCGGLVGLLGPKPLQAQDAECIDQEMDMMFAAGAFALAELAAAAACPSLGPGCALALSALALAAAYLTWTTSSYQACLYDQQEPQNNYQGQVGGGTTDPSTACETYIIEISYNGGLSWHYLGSFEYCP